ncbi:hypothetical protein EUX98_g1784 [Antrodiella citrinella]|uniref:Cytochrome P450 n=1 Tax=Antrodiella citrinella TaxID=2447956 RepID=A0A4S4N268_9APHY|nr:hypothetical protein EUX98_g1784 [Antrodiella citrinella]
MGTQGLARGPAYDGLAAHAADRAILTWRDATIHAKRRIPWIHGFNAAALKEYEPALNERVVQLVDGLLQRHGTVDVMESIKFFSYDFMGDMAQVLLLFNGVSELMRDGDTHGQMQVVQTCIDSTIMRETMPWLTRYISDGADPLRAAAAVMGMQRVQKAISRRDLFYYLNNDDGAEAVSPPLSVVIAEAALVIIAGSDTTSGTLCNILYSLVRHPDVYKELQEEVDKFYPLGENALDSAFHSKMTFLEAVINETLRLYPVVPSGSQRFTSEGVTISSWYIFDSSHSIESLTGYWLPSYVPRNTSVRSHTWSIHRDPRNFSPFTNEFWPERWLIAEKSSSYQSEKPFIHNLNAYIPFSFGPANCVGKHLALKEIRTVLCYLLQQVSLRFAEGFDPDTWDSHLKDNLTLEVGHLPVVVTARGVSKP